MDSESKLDLKKEIYKANYDPEYSPLKGLIHLYQ